MTRQLDPYTLRWVADENEVEKERWLSWASEQDSDEYACQTKYECQTKAREYAMTAKRYRALATRIENKRKP